MFAMPINRDQFRPPDWVLSRCECVKFPRHAWPLKKRLYIKVLRDWAREHCESFIWWRLEHHDDEFPVDRAEVWLFYFYKPEDATAFTLRWH